MSYEEVLVLRSLKNKIQTKRCLAKMWKFILSVYKLPLGKGPQMGKTALSLKWGGKSNPLSLSVSGFINAVSSLAFYFLIGSFLNSYPLLLF